MRKELKWKITDKTGQSGVCQWVNRSLQWGVNTTHEVVAEEDCISVCTENVIHVYDHPIVAHIMDPAHAEYRKYSQPQLWVATVSGRCDRELLKEGYTQVTTVCRWPWPDWGRAHSLCLCLNLMDWVTRAQGLPYSLPLGLSSWEDRLSPLLKKAKKDLIAGKPSAGDLPSHIAYLIDEYIQYQNANPAKLITLDCELATTVERETNGMTRATFYKLIAQTEKEMRNAAR